MIVHAYLPSPIGAIHLVAAGDALRGLYMEDHRHERPPGADWRLDDRHPVFLEAAKQLAAYFAGELRDFDLPLAPVGTPFQRRVWDALRGIPYGATTTYGELARAIEAPTASRAVGAANGRNPLSIVVPCHRVIGANGDLVGYGGGMPRKVALLALERGIRA